MKQIVYKNGASLVDYVPKPSIMPGTVIVKVCYSCISQGTELAGIKNSGKNRVDKIRSIIHDKPKAIKKAIQIFKEEGLHSFYNKYQTLTKPNTTSSPIGYSISGIIEQVGDNINDLQIGDRVACAGAGMASHAEYVVVPRNLILKIPKALDMKDASTVALGGIAIQGIRRGDFKLGEMVTVIGLGFLGQLTIQLLNASGCRVIAIDIDDERCELAKKNGAERVLNSSEYNKIENTVKKITNGYGVDGVIFTAATNDSSVISSAFKMCKRKGKVILVGVAGNKIRRQDLYANELDFLISTSYGPGRYDDSYELNGIDYPYAYVRWTENRNMDEYLRLLSRKTLQINNLIGKVYKIEEAKEAYQELLNLQPKSIIALFEYNHEEVDENKTIMNIASYTTINKKIINVAIIGAGGFAKSMHLPNLQILKDKYNIYAICDINALNAKETAKQYNSKIATTDFEEVLKDDNIDVVMICTRHNLHANYSIKALKAGKAVFVEKPMAINNDELEELKSVIEQTRLPFMVGFNRRFSPFAKEIKNNIKDRLNPMIISYRMNAGYIPLDVWVHEDGGRIIGEACHIIDLFNFFINAEILTISVEKITPNTKAFSSKDNFSATIKYRDGSIANLIYTALGNSIYPKEKLEIYCDNIIYKMVDYFELKICSDKIRKKTLKIQDKGHLQELIEFYHSISKNGDSIPININDLVETTQATFIIND